MSPQLTALFITEQHQHGGNNVKKKIQISSLVRQIRCSPIILNFSSPSPRHTSPLPSSRGALILHSLSILVSYILSLNQFSTFIIVQYRCCDKRSIKHEALHNACNCNLYHPYHIIVYYHVLGKSSYAYISICQT